MKSILKNWVFLFLILLLNNCGSHKPQTDGPTKPMEKAYVLLRTEGSENDITQLKNILSSDFVTNDVTSNIVTYPLGKSWNNNQIFTTAYNDNYDYIVLIDQVAKFTIDDRTQIGGKYQIRSYHIKSPDPDWIDLGQKTCNVTVKPSIKKFSEQIVSNIVPNYKSSHLDTDEKYAENSSNSNSEYLTLKTSNEVDSDIEKLKQQLKLEKEKTDKVLAEKERLEKQYEDELAKEKMKTKLVLADLEIVKKEKKLAIVKAKKIQEAKDIALAEAKKQRQKEIADIYYARKEEIRKREAEEALKNPPIVVSVPKEPTREERLKERLEAKKRLAEERTLKRKKEEEAALQRQEERRRLVELKRNEQKRIQETLAAERKEQRRLAEQKTAEDIKIKEQLKLEKLEDQKRNAEEIEAQNKIEALAETKRVEAQKIKIQKEAEENAIAEAKQKEKDRISQENDLAETRLIEKRNAEEIEAQKKKEALAETKRVEAQKIKIQKEAEENAIAEAKQKEKDRIRKENDLAEARLLEEKNKEKEIRLAQEKEKKEAFLLKKQLEKNQRLAEVKEKKKNIKKPKSKVFKGNKHQINTKNSNNNKTSTLVILRAKKDDEVNLKNLKDNIEFDFLFANTKATTNIYNKDYELNKTDIVNINNSSYDSIVIIDQLEYQGDGYSNYQISTYNYSTNSDWNELELQPFNISDRSSIKEFSKKIINSL